MDWFSGVTCDFAYGREFAYLVTRDERGVRLGRFSVNAAAANLHAVVAREALESAIIFPLGRGPGRPGGEPELAALVKSAKLYAEWFEAGESLEGYPGWQREHGTVHESADAMFGYLDRPGAERELPRSTDWAWGDGTPLPEDRWPPAAYHGPLVMCAAYRVVHAAHWTDPYPAMRRSWRRVWCPGRLAAEEVS
jgi:hypothetical protein